MPRAHRVLLFLVAIVLTSCGAPALPTGPGGMATPPGGGGGKYQCKNVSGRTDPWLIEWDATQKARMQAAARDGVLLVRYEGCELEVLYGCEQVGAYDIVPTTLSTNTEYITNEDELFAKLPIGALKLVGEFRQGERWSLDYAILGMQKTRLESIDADSLEGGCARATHFVSAMAVGAYRLVSEAKRKAAAGVEVLGAGAGASTGGAAGALRQAGAYDRCVSDATSSDSACQAVVQLFLEPLAGRTTTSADGAEGRSLLPSVSIEGAVLELGQPGPEVFYVSGRMRPSVAEIVAVQLPPALAGSWKRLLRAEEAVSAANRARAKERDKLEALCRRPNDRCASRAVYDCPASITFPR
jgi:hypothetical protein